MKTAHFLLAMLISFTACAGTMSAESADYFSENRTTGSFYGLVVNVPANVILSQGNVNEVRVEGDRALLNAVKTSVENGALVINGTNYRPVTIYVTLEEINRVEVNGSARVYSNSPVNSDMMLLKVNGSGSIRMDVRVLNLGLIVRGSGKIFASGSTERVSSRVIGSGNIYAQNLDSFYQKDQYIYQDADLNKDGSRPKLNLHN